MLHPLIWLLAVLLAVEATPSDDSLRTIYEWKYIDYWFPSPAARKWAIARGDYNNTKPVMIDVDRDRNGRIFVTVIRAKGVPASLTVVLEQEGESRLMPYPNWHWTSTDNCNNIISVYRVAIDECNRLWVLDTGYIENQYVCPAKLLVFDLDNDKLIKSIKIPDNVSQNSITKESLLVTPVVEIEEGNCRQTTVYMADVKGNGLIIYNGRDIWRLESPVFDPDPSATNFTIENESFILPDGVLGLALSPPNLYGKRSLYFRPLASRKLFKVNTYYLKKSYPGTRMPVVYYTSENFMPSQAAGQAFNCKGALLFGLPTQTSLACWNMRNPMSQEYIHYVHTDRKRLQFLSGVKVVPSNRRKGHGEEILVASIRLQKIYNSNMNFNEVNFRILNGSVANMIPNACKTPRGHYPVHYS